MEKQTIYLYNEFLMDEDGENFLAFQPGFKSLEAAQAWLDRNELDYTAIRGKRIGDHLVPRDVVQTLTIDNRERQTLSAAVRFVKFSTPCWRGDFWQNEGIPMYDSTEAELLYLDNFYDPLF